MASRFWVGGTGTWDNITTTHWSGTSGGAGGASVPGVGDTVTFDANSGGGTVTPNYNLSISVLTLDAFTGTLDFSANNNSPTLVSISSTGTGSKTFNMGSGTWTVTGTSTPWNLNTTGITLNPGTSTILMTGNAVTFAGGSGNNYYNISFTGGGASIYSTTGTCNNLTYTGIGAGDSLSMNAAKTINGTLTVTGASAVNRASIVSTSAGSARTLTFSGAAFTNASFVDIAMTYVGGAGTWALTENLVVTTTAASATLTITSGTFSANNFNITFPNFSSSNANVRTINMGSGTWAITGSGSTVWTLNTSTNLTLNASTSTLNFTYSGSIGTRIFSSSSGLVYNNINVTAGSDTFSAASTSVLTGNFSTAGFTGTYSKGTSGLTVAGNFTLGAGSIWTSTSSTITLNSSGSCAINLNGVNMNQSVTINNAVGVFTLQNDLNLAGAVAAVLNITAGTFNGNGFNISAATFNSSNSNIRTINMGSGTWTLFGTPTVFTLFVSTNLSFNADTSTIKITDSSNNAVTFTGGGQNFYNIWFSRGASTASNTISGNNSFNNFKDDGSAAHSLIFTAASNTTVSTWAVSGSSGNVITLNSSSTTAFNLVKIGADVISSDWLNIQHSIATPQLTWYAGANSVNNQSVATAGSGWIFTTPPVMQLSNITSISNISQIGG